ncbi:hypothetical protein JTB14_006139 [Gonioctena quinquepunctata]|nr:hypothetical protein JTB14_006139 [Gonioctena quinquepunctata]
MSNRKPKNHYDSLGIAASSTQGEVKSAYYKLSMMYHPDKTQDAASSQKFRDITEAYEVLGNVKTRKLYDKGLYFGSTSAPTDDVVDRFHKSRETRSRPPPPSGRTPIYDFDEWSKSHYGATFKRQMENKRRATMYKIRREEDLNDIKMEKLIFGVLVLIVICTLYVNHKDYDTVYINPSRTSQSRDSTN